MKRWNFLKLLIEASHTGSVQCFDETLALHSDLSEAVMENSSKDRVSHFFLRLAVAKINDAAVKETFLKGETCLFSYRITENSRPDLANRLADVVRHIDQLETEDNEFDILSESIVTLLRQEMLDAGNGNEHEGFKVPFYVVPSLVATRQVQLDHGMAIIDSVNVRKFLSCVFTKILCSSLSNMTAIALRYGAEDDDQRLIVLIRRIKHQVRGPRQTLLPIGVLRAHEIDKASLHFPPCFAHVHNHLSRTHHRLGHHARIAYTLFLKEIGLTLDEAFKFWSFHYSKRPSHHHEQKCAHSWQENTKKFEYSINHLYGNAGGRKNYSAHSCAAIAERRSSVNEELTCPYIGDIEDAATDPTQKCLEHLRKSNEGIKTNCSIRKPSNYFHLAVGKHDGENK